MVVRLNGDFYYSTTMSFVELVEIREVGLGTFSHFLNEQKSKIAPSSLPCTFRVLGANSGTKRDR